MRIGVFGGTFDPVHQGHLILAEQARELGPLDQVWFVPAPRPPHKDADSVTRFEQRVEMLQLAIAGQPAFRVDEIEKDRAGPSFSVDTLATFHKLHPEHEYFLLVGSDTVVDISHWREPRRLLAMAGLLAMGRPHNPMPDLSTLRQELQLGSDETLNLKVLDAPLIDISSRDLRRRAAAGRSLRYFLPRAVEVYIQEKRLYR